MMDRKGADRKGQELTGEEWKRADRGESSGTRFLN